MSCSYRSWWNGAKNTAVLRNNHDSCTAIRVSPAYGPQALSREGEKRASSIATSYASPRCSALEKEVDISRLSNADFHIRGKNNERVWQLNRKTHGYGPSMDSAWRYEAVAEIRKDLWVLNLVRACIFCSCASLCQSNRTLVVSCHETSGYISELNAVQVFLRLGVGTALRHLPAPLQ